MKVTKKRIAKIYKHLVLLSCYLKKIKFFSKQEKPKIIICFDGNIPHGGLVDRLKGIISFYEISKILGMEFKILFTHPFELKSFLEPNQIDWSINENEIEYNFLDSKIVYLMNDFGAKPLEILKKSKAKKFFIYCNIDYLDSIYPNKKEDEIKAVWKNNYSDLFKLSNYLEEKINSVSSESRIAFHTRFTTLFGDFSDSTRKILDENEKLVLTQKVVTAINKEVSQHPGKIVYVFSDSNFFLNYIKKNTPYKTLEGVPKHIENNNPDVDHHFKTFLDFYFLAASQQVFLIKIDEMYYSSFSKYAAMIGNSDFKCIMN